MLKNQAGNTKTSLSQNAGPGLPSLLPSKTNTCTNCLIHHRNFIPLAVTDANGSSTLCSPISLLKRPIRQTTTCGTVALSVPLFINWHVLVASAKEISPPHKPPQKPITRLDPLITITLCLVLLVVLHFSSTSYACNISSKIFYTSSLVLFDIPAHAFFTSMNKLREELRVGRIRSESKYLSCLSHESMRSSCTNDTVQMGVSSRRS